MNRKITNSFFYFARLGFDINQEIFWVSYYFHYYL
jgi:hypothetical protein